MKSYLLVSCFLVFNVFSMDFIHSLKSSSKHKKKYEQKKQEVEKYKSFLEKPESVDTAQDSPWLANDLLRAELLALGERLKENQSEDGDEFLIMHEKYNKLYQVKKQKQLLYERCKNNWKEPYTNAENEYKNKNYKIAALQMESAEKNTQSPYYDLLDYKKSEEVLNSIDKLRVVSSLCLYSAQENTDQHKS